VNPQIIYGPECLPFETVQIAKIYRFAQIFDGTLFVAICQMLQPRNVGELRAAIKVKQMHHASD
jgi:hypothetical protein